MQLEDELSTWIAELPQSLKPMGTPAMVSLAEDGNAAIDRWRVIITLRYLNVRCLLHRSVFNIILDSTREQRNATCGSFVAQVSAASVDAAIEAAFETIAIVSRAAERQHCLPVWWYSNYFSKTSSPERIPFEKLTVDWR